MAALDWGPHAVDAEPFTLDGAGGASIDAFHARPEGSVASGIVLHPDIGGFRPLFDDMARRIASHGFAVAAFEPFGRVSREERAGMDLDARMRAIGRLVDAEQLGDMASAADALVARDDVTKVATLGFCMGGMYTLKAAATGRFDRAVAFYGQLTVPEGWRGPGLAGPLATAGDVCPTLAVLGGRDDFTPAEDIDALRAAWADRSDCEIAFYPDADHGFVHDPDRPAHRADDAADAWRRALEFLA